MEPELWKAIQHLFDQVDTSFNHLQAAGDHDPLKEPDGSDENMDLIAARSKIREEFDHLRVTLLAYLSEQECYQVLFPLVVYFDEQVQTIFFKEKQISWPLLQKELYEVDNGGELFYNILDSILRKPQTSEFIFEVNYFCLKHGFQGKYVDDPIRIKKYMDKLKDKISIQQMEGTRIFAEETGPMRYFVSPSWLYGGAMLFLILFYGILRFIA
ncbi:MAG: DotU family type IV/VI secretion system protein [Proteobacteria bacterium]|nr:DotU family type IV/VI secretion system protein [Pseudomonadota bacterium]MBU1583468.1 DotU family type IV/VI secretion system protein [Pseudomonadota bacterium]MBU2628467.1 DotU family type IV/VI secretion system protein [Pseudomonadota bacterium]